MSKQNDRRPAATIAAGSFVVAELEGRRVLCLKAERRGKDHVNHFLVPLAPVPDRRTLALAYTDPDAAIEPADGVSLALADAAEEGPPEIGDAFAAAGATYLKLADGPQSQRLHAYVDLSTGQVRPRMDRHAVRRLVWSVRQD